MNTRFYPIDVGFPMTNTLVGQNRFFEGRNSNLVDLQKKERNPIQGNQELQEKIRNIWDFFCDAL